MTALEKRQLQERIDDLNEVMRSPAGRRFVWRQLGDAGVFRSSFVAGSADITAFNEGSRNNGLTLLAEITEHMPGSFLIMQKEAIDNEQKNKIERDRNRKKDRADSGGGDNDD